MVLASADAPSAGATVAAGERAAEFSGSGLSSAGGSAVRLSPCITRSPTDDVLCSVAPGERNLGPWAVRVRRVGSRASSLK